jgi:hypothetical protein
MSTSSKDVDLARCCPVHQLHDLSLTTLECMLVAELVLTCDQDRFPEGLVNAVRDQLQHASCQIRLESDPTTGEQQIISHFCHADSCCCPECQKGGE